jgi:hypothetical protein
MADHLKKPNSSEQGIVKLIYAGEPRALRICPIHFWPLAP